MRVALSLMKRNQKRILSCTEFEDAMQLLLSRSLWDTYAQHADDLVADFTSLTGLVTRESLQTLETSFKDSQSGRMPSLKAAASQILGRFWAGSSHGTSKSLNALAIPSRPASSIRRTPSKQSLASTLGSFETISDASTAPTEVSLVSRKSDPTTIDASPPDRSSAANKDKDLHSQIEDLLIALSDMQREHSSMARELQKEREEREEDGDIARALLIKLKQQAEAATEILGDDKDIETREIIGKAEERYNTRISKRTSLLQQTKHQLRDTAMEWKARHELEASRCQDLTKKLDESEKEHMQLKDQLREARSRIQEGHKEKQRLEKTVQDLRRSIPNPESPSDSEFSPVSESSMRSPTGLRELRLGKPETTTTTVFSKRSSSLLTQPVLSTQDHKPVGEDALLLELVNAKTAEATARQELEEVKGKLEALRKMLGGRAPSPSTRPIVDSGVSSVPVTTTIMTPKTPAESPKGSAVNTGGFFSGWGKRSVSNFG